MASVGKFERDKYTLDVNAGRYSLAEEFVPPSVGRAATIARGTAANKAGGQTVDTTPIQRRWEIKLVVQGSSKAEVRRGIADLEQFLAGVGDTDTPTYFAWRDVDNFSFEPFWGQEGAYLRYELLAANTNIDDGWQPYSAGGYAKAATVNVISKPHAVGIRQRLGQAVGGVLEDFRFSGDGRSRGTMIPPATRNEISNPIFGHGTWNNDWVDGADLIDTENTDPEFKLFGNSSAKITATGSSTNRYDIAVTAPNTNTHCISIHAKKQDGSAVVDADIDIEYPSGSNLTDSFESYGDGWYRVWATAAGVASAQTLRFVVTEGLTLYIDGVQFEESAYPTPLAHGDMLGCAWVGTVHDSDTTRTAARIRVDEDDIWDRAEGTIRMVWLPDHNSSDQTANIQLFEMNAGNDVLAQWTQATGVFGFSDGTNAANSAVSQTYTAGTPVVFHWTWGPDGLAQYIDGAAAGTDASYNPQDPTDWFYIGTSEAAGSHCGGTILGFDSFARAMSATEVSNDYTNISELSDEKNRVSSIPWEWTKDGDSVVDNANDATRDNYCVAGGIPGSMEAKTAWRAQTANLEAVEEYYYSLIPMTEFVDPIFLYEDLGTTETVDTTEDIIWTTSTFTDLRQTELLLGKTFNILCRAHDNGDEDQQAAMRIAAANVHGGEYLGKYGPATFHRSASTYSNSMSPPFVTVERSAAEKMLELEFSMSFELWAKRTAGSATIDIELCCIFLEPVVHLVPDSNASGTSYFTYSGKSAHVLNDSFLNTGEFFVDGGPIEFVPERLNVLMSMKGGPGEIAQDADTITYNHIYIRPRYMLL